MYKPALLTLVLPAAIATAGCGGDPSAPSEPHGTYALVALDGRDLPLVVEERAGFRCAPADTFRGQVTGGDLAFYSGDRVRLQITFLNTCDWVAVDSVAPGGGTYHVEGVFEYADPQLTVYGESGSSILSGSLQNGTLQLTGSLAFGPYREPRVGTIYTFHKR